MRAIRAGTLIDGTGTSPISGATVLIEGSQVKAVLPSLDAAVPPGTEVLDASDAFVMPGFIDLHTHLRNPHTADVAAEKRYQYRIETEPPLAVFYAAHAAHVTMMSGFTTLRMMGGIEYVALRRAIDERLVPGPRVLVSGMVLMTGGHTDRTLPATVSRTYPFEAWKTADGVDGVRKRVRELARAGADFIKFDAGGGLHYPDVWLYTESEMKAIVEEAHNFGLPVAAHAHGREAILRAVRAGVDTLEHGTFVDDACIEEMLKHDVTFVPTLSIMHDTIAHGPQWGHSSTTAEKYKRLDHTRQAAVRKAYAAGIRIGLGTDSSGWVAPHGSNGVEFGLLVSAGLTAMAAIQAGTSNAARALRLSDRIGTIEPGKVADLVLLTVDPTRDIAALGDPKNVSAVFRNGDIMPAPWKSPTA